MHGIDTDTLMEWLDEAVHAAKGAEAAEINNAGVDAQLAYLGMTREQAIAAIQE